MPRRDAISRTLPAYFARNVNQVASDATQNSGRDEPNKSWPDEVNLHIINSDKIIDIINCEKLPSA